MLEVTLDKLHKVVIIMLQRTLVLVDTSYLLASFYNSWEEGARGQLEISLASVVHRLDQVAHGLVDQPVQRQN